MVSLRVFYWFTATITTTKNKALLDILFSRIAFPRLIGGDSTRSLLQSVVDVKQFAKDLYWEAFEDYVGVFVQKLRRKKYFSFNLDSIPEHKVEKFSHLFEYSSVYDFHLADQLVAETPLRMTVVLPPDCRCYGCKRDLGGAEAQYQNQFPSPALANLVPSQTFQVKHPEMPVLHQKISRSFFLASCGDRPDCVAKVTAAQLKFESYEAELLIDFLSHSWLCNGCLRYSMKTHRCSKCKSVLYCSQLCLEKDWKNHKFSCQVLDDAETEVRSSRRLNAEGRARHERQAEFILGRLDPFLFMFVDS